MKEKGGIEQSINDSLINTDKEQNYEKKKIGTIGPLLWIYGDHQRVIKLLCTQTKWHSQDIELKEQLQKQLKELRKQLNLSYHLGKKVYPPMMVGMIFMGFFLMPQIVLKIYGEQKTDSIQIFQIICACLVMVLMLVASFNLLRTECKCKAKLIEQIQKLNNTDRIRSKQIFLKPKGQFERDPDQTQFPKWMSCMNKGILRLSFNQFNQVQVFQMVDKRN